MISLIQNVMFLCLYLLFILLCLKYCSIGNFLKKQTVIYVAMRILFSRLSIQKFVSFLKDPWISSFSILGQKLMKSTKELIYQIERVYMGFARQGSVRI